MQICVKNLQKTFKIKAGGFFKAKKVTNVNAVENVSFEVEKGEIVAFIGPNGAGKSTKCLLVLYNLVVDKLKLQDLIHQNKENN